MGFLWDSCVVYCRIRVGLVEVVHMMRAQDSYIGSYIGSCLDAYIEANRLRQTN